MDTNSNPLHRPLAVGDWVIVGRGEEYAGLTGQITEINKLGSPGHDTGNETDDIIVDLSRMDYTDGMEGEIAAKMKELGYDSFDDVALDCVILAPDDLIQVSEREIGKHHADLTASLESACDVGEALSYQHYNEIAQALIDRLKHNYADYERETLGYGAKDIFDMAARVHAVSDAYSYLTVCHDFSEEELRFYLQFQNPLDIVAQAWHERNMDLGDMSSTMYSLWEAREKVSRENAPVRPLAVDGKLSAQRLEESYKAFIDQAIRNNAEPPQAATPLERLYAKMSDEYKGFLDELKLKPESEIIQAAYEKVFKEELLLTVGNEVLSDARIAALLTLETPLADLYWNWLDVDASYMDVLRDSVEEYADAVILERKTELAKAEPAHAPQENLKAQQRPTASKEPPSLLGEIREAAREVEALKAARQAPTTTKNMKKENELS